MPAESALTLVDHALAYARRGLEVFPLAPDKAPLAEHGMKDATTDPAIIRAWWAKYPGALIGCRIPPGMVVLDIDPRHGGDGTWQALVDHYGPCVAKREHLSGRGDGGAHRWFRRPPGKLSIKALDAWAKENGVGHAAGQRRWTGGIDILHHDHRYTILPPSPHPATGQPYAWRVDDDPDDMPGWLAHYVTAAPTPLPAPRTPLRIADADSIADWYSATRSWTEILGPAGWVLVAGDGDADGSKWRHPNASAAQSSSVRHGCLFVYSPNTDFDPTEDGTPNGYTRFRAWAMLEHDGDMTRAAHAARELRGDEPGFSIHDLATRRTTDPATGEEVIAWPELIPFDLPPDGLPAWPVHVLPDWMRDHALAVADRVQVPIDMAAQAGLLALAAAVVGRCEIVVGPTWRMPLNLYLATVGVSGAGKSPVSAAMFGPLYALEQELMGETRPAITEATTRADIAQAQARKAVEAARSGKGEAAEAVSLMLDAENLRQSIPPSPRLLVDDATPEALSLVLSRCGGRAAVVSAESAVIDQALGLYGRQTPNIDVWLKGWGGEPLRIDRKGSGNQAPTEIVLPEVHLTIGVSMQPVTLDKLGQDPMLAGRGFIWRFMFACPATMLGRRDRRRALGPGDAGEEYATRLAKLARLHQTSSAKAAYRFSPEATTMFGDWLDAVESDLGEEGGLARISEWVAKWQASVARVAALLHLADGLSSSVPVGADHLSRAFAVGDYWLAHFRSITSGWHRSGADDLAMRIVRWVRSEGCERFTTREVQHQLRRQVGTVEELVEPIRALLRRGYLVPLESDQSVIGRHKGASPVWLVNPASVDNSGPLSPLSTAPYTVNEKSQYSSPQVTPPLPTHSPEVSTEATEQEPPSNPTWKDLI